MPPRRLHPWLEAKFDPGADADSRPRP